MANATSPGLTALADTSVQALAASPESTDVLANMQKRAEQLSSPWHGLQNALDDMVAHTGYRPSAALEQRALQKSSESQELQNIGMTRAQVEMLKQQLAIASGATPNVKTGVPSQTTVEGKTPIGAPTMESGASGMKQYRNTDVPLPTWNSIQGYLGRGLLDKADEELSKFAGIKAKSDLDAQNDPAKATAEVKVYNKDGILETVPWMYYQLHKNEYSIMPPGSSQADKDKAKQPAPSGTLAQASVSSNLGVRQNPQTGALENHKGTDLAIPKGTPINAFNSGTVVYSGDANDGFGNKVVVQNPNGSTEIYAHLDKVNVKSGEPIDKSSVLGFSGDTGNARGAHLHYEVRQPQAGTNTQPTNLNLKAPTQTNLGSSQIAPVSAPSVNTFGAPTTRLQSLQQSELDKKQGEINLEINKQNQIKQNEANVASDKVEQLHYNNMANSAKETDLATFENLLGGADKNPDLFAKGKQTPTSNIAMEAIKNAPFGMGIKDPKAFVIAALPADKKASYGELDSLATRAALAYARQMTGPGQRESNMMIQNAQLGKGVGLENFYTAARPRMIEGLASTRRSMDINNGWEEFQIQQKSKGNTAPSWSDYKTTKYYRETVPQNYENLIKKMNTPGHVFVKPGTVIKDHVFTGDYGDSGSDTKNWKKVEK